MQNASLLMRLSLNGNDIKGDAVHDGQACRMIPHAVCSMMPGSFIGALYNAV